MVMMGTRRRNSGIAKQVERLSQVITCVSEVIEGKGRNGVFGVLLGVHHVMNGGFSMFRGGRCCVSYC